MQLTSLQCSEEEPEAMCLGTDMPGGQRASSGAAHPKPRRLPPQQATTHVSKANDMPVILTLWLGERNQGRPQGHATWALHHSVGVHLWP